VNGDESFALANRRRPVNTFPETTTTAAFEDHGVIALDGEAGANVLDQLARTGVDLNDAGRTKEDQRVDPFPSLAELLETPCNTAHQPSDC
jgi:hypothetical protein